MFDLDISSAIPQSLPVVAMWVFGSVARGDAREDSDLDVAVLLRDGDARPHRRALLDLTARLESAAGRRVDLTVLGLRDPILAHRVLSEGLCVHDADPPTRHAFEADAIARYLDWAPSYARAVDDTLRANLEWARH